MTGQVRTGDVRTSRDRSEQAKTGYDMLGCVRMCREENRAGQGRSEQVKTV